MTIENNRWPFKNVQKHRWNKAIFSEILVENSILIKKCHFQTEKIRSEDFRLNSPNTKWLFLTKREKFYM